ncbi:hypothetical protein EJB05_30499, partial [Eragrostis curvula]
PGWSGNRTISLAYISAQPAPGCQTHCEDVEIPYPFGIVDTGCALEKGFEINCSKTVDDPWWLDFSGWPYRFSNVDNKFIVMGCNTLAYLCNRYNRTGYTTACASVCENPKALTNGSCLGVGCCQNAINRRLNTLRCFISRDSNSYQFNQCCYAALVATETFNFSSEFITTMRFNETYKGQQPLVLDWAIGNVTCNVAKTCPLTHVVIETAHVWIQPMALGIYVNAQMGMKGTLISQMAAPKRSKRKEKEQKKRKGVEDR